MNSKIRSALDGFDEPVIAFVRTGHVVSLKRVAGVPCKVKSSELGMTRPGLRVCRMMNANQILFDAQDPKGADPKDVVVNPLPFDVERGSYVQLWVRNDTKFTIGVQWRIEVEKMLFAVALERFNSDGMMVEANIAHIHALNAQQAEAYIMAAEPKTTRLVGVSRVVGFIAEDEHGDKLRA